MTVTDTATGMLTVLAGRGSTRKPATGDDAVRLTARTFLGAGVIPNEIRPFAAACPVLGEIADAMDAALEALSGAR